MLCQKHGLWIHVHHSMLLLLRSVLLPLMQAIMDMYTLEVTMDMYAFSIGGIGIVHLTVDGTNELVLHDLRYVPSIKKSLLFVGQMDMHGYSTLFEKGSWKALG